MTPDESRKIHKALGLPDVEEETRKALEETRKALE